MTAAHSSKTPLIQFVLEKLDDIKAKEIIVLDVSNQTALTDYMVIATGTSTQHVRSIAENLMTEAKKDHRHLVGHEGLSMGEWALVDLNDVLVHVMLPQARTYYELEKLWSVETLSASNNIAHSQMA